MCFPRLRLYTVFFYCIFKVKNTDTTPVHFQSLANIYLCTIISYGNIRKQVKIWRFLKIEILPASVPIFSFAMKLKLSKNKPINRYIWICLTKCCIFYAVWKCKYFPRSFVKWLLCLEITRHSSRHISGGTVNTRYFLVLRWWLFPWKWRNGAWKNATGNNWTGKNVTKKNYRKDWHRK